MNETLVKEALIQLAANSQLTAPRLRSPNADQEARKRMGYAGFYVSKSQPPPAPKVQQPAAKKNPLTFAQFQAFAQKKGWKEQNGTWISPSGQKFTTESVVGRLAKKNNPAPVPTKAPAVPKRSVIYNNYGNFKANPKQGYTARIVNGRRIIYATGPRARMSSTPTPASTFKPQAATTGRYDYATKPMPKGMVASTGTRNFWNNVPNAQTDTNNTGVDYFHQYQ